MKNTETILKIIGIVACLFFILFPDYPQFLEYGFVISILLVIGIPHGAIDHLTSDPSIDLKGLSIFLARYLGLIGIYLIVWSFLPQFALLIFLGFSAYHFGQTHFLKDSIRSIQSTLLYLSRGAFFLAVILFGDFQMTKFILDPIVDLQNTQGYGLPIILFLFVLTTALEYQSHRRISKSSIVDLVILAPILFFTPLFVGFIVYFGFWHAFPSMRLEYEFLGQFPKYQSFKKFASQMIPFTILSLVGIAGLLFAGNHFLSENELMLLFFILISLISFPHIFYMDHFIKKFKTAQS